MNIACETTNRITTKVSLTQLVVANLSTKEAWLCFCPLNLVKASDQKPRKGTIKSSRKIFTDHLGSRILIPVANASSGDM